MGARLGTAEELTLTKAPSIVQPLRPNRNGDYRIVVNSIDIPLNTVYRRKFGQVGWTIKLSERMSFLKAQSCSRAPAERGTRGKLFLPCKCLVSRRVKPSLWRMSTIKQGAWVGLCFQEAKRSERSKFMEEALQKLEQMPEIEFQNFFRSLPLRVQMLVRSGMADWRQVLPEWYIKYE